MGLMTLDQVLDNVMQLSYEQKKMLVDMVRKREIEERREQIRQHADEAIRAFHAGELKTERTSELIRRLHASVEQELSHEAQVN